MYTSTSWCMILASLQIETNKPCSRNISLHYEEYICDQRSRARSEYYVTWGQINKQPQVGGPDIHMMSAWVDRRSEPTFYHWTLRFMHYIGRDRFVIKNKCVFQNYCLKFRINNQAIIIQLLQFFLDHQRATRTEYTSLQWYPHSVNISSPFGSVPLSFAVVPTGPPTAAIYPTIAAIDPPTPTTDSYHRQPPSTHRQPPSGHR